MVAFEVIEHTADVGIVAHGAQLKEAFANAGVGLFSLIGDLEEVKEATFREVKVTAPDQEALLVEWLNELIYLFDVENILFKRFEILELTTTRLRARAYGERVDPSRHHLKLGVKAATYHMLRIDKGDGYRLQVLFDI